MSAAPQLIEVAAGGELLSVADVAKWLKVSPAWVRSHANGNRRPSIPCLKLGGCLRFERRAIQQWLREQQRNYERIT